MFSNFNYNHPIISFLICVVIVVSSLFILVYNLEKIACSKKATIMEIESNYSFWAACMVKIDDKWQPFNEYNTVNLNK